MDTFAQVNIYIQYYFRQTSSISKKAHTRSRYLPREESLSAGRKEKPWHTGRSVVETGESSCV